MSALLRWRAAFKSDAATRFGEAEGGLNQMTIRLRRFTSVLPREMSTAIVRCALVARAGEGG